MPLMAATAPGEGARRLRKEGSRVERETHARGVIRVLLVSSTEAMLLGLRSMLERAGDIEVPISARPEEVLEPREGSPVDIAVVDAGQGGLVVCQALARARPALPILMLTAQDDELLMEAWRLGAGLFPISITADALAQAAREAAGGRAPPFTREQQDRIRDWQIEVQKRIGRLTAREREAVRLYLEQRSKREIADAMSITERAVDNYLSSAVGKMGMSSRVEMAIFLIRNRISLR
jgi:DNA-binding NarL/FixJ family response regulator